MPKVLKNIDSQNAPTRAQIIKQKQEKKNKTS